MKTASRRHVPALDGVRGLAILVVFLFHVSAYGWPGQAAGVDGLVRRVMQAGWVGVDLFFVLSGYLITGILVASAGQERYFRNFYIRRSLRIFPLFYLALVVFGIVARWFPAVRATGGAALANWTYTSNIYMAIHGWESQPTVMQPFWSLAVEEQFYLVWPFVIALFGKGKLAIACIIGILVSIAVRAFALRSGNELAAYMLLPARMDSLMLGALTGISIGWERPAKPVWLPSAMQLALWCFVAAIALVLIRAFVWESPIIQALKSTLISTAFAGLLATAILSRGRFGSFLSALPLRLLGRYSYSMYVFHAAVITAIASFITIAALPAVGGSRVPSALLFAFVAMTVTFAVAAITWHFFEVHFLRLKDRLTVIQREPN